MINELIICVLSFSIFLLIDKFNTCLAFILCTIFIYIFLRLKILHHRCFPSFPLIINQQNIYFVSLSHGLSYFFQSSESVSCFSQRFKKSCNGMIIEVILWFSSFLLFLLIEKYFSLLVAFIICLLLVHFYVRLRATFHNFVSSTFHDLYNKIASYRLFRISFRLAYTSEIYKRTYYFLGQLFCFQKTSIPIPAENQNFQSCGDVLIIDSEINVLVQNISKHYICSWYYRLGDNDEFIHLLNKSIKETLHRLCSRILQIERKKISYTILQIYLHFFSHFVEAKKSSESFSWDNVQMRHWAMRDTATERCYLQSLISALLDKFGPFESENSLHSKSCSLLHAIVVEILTETLIQPLVRVFSDPSRINLLILWILANKEDSTETLTVAKLPSNSYNKSQPTIILPSDDVSVVSKPIIAKKVTSQSRLTVPTSSNCNKKAPNISENPGHELSVESSSFASLAVSLKSSSNSYLSNYDICNITDLDCDDSASDICDNALIKRSKSADYIRQMPQLKALNEKDYDIKLQKGNNKMLVVVKSDSNSNCSIEQAEEAVELEVPTLFTDIKITDTIQQNEDGIVPYTLYCIEYTGIFHDTRSVLGSPQFVTQNVSIKRRFSEFVALQSRLEENPVLKIFLKGIKGPSKWTTLPFSNLDKRYIAERKVFLENYLKALCDIAPIAQSSELQEFLAYGGDARISFVRRTGDISVPRIDKFFVRGVRGAIDMFKTALPSSPLEVEGILPVKTSLEEPSSDQRFHEYLLDFSYREPEIKEHVNNFFQNSVGNQSYENSSHKGKDIDAKGKKSSLLRNLSNFKIEECCSCTGLHDNYLEDEYPFGNTMIELLDAAVDFNAMKLGDLRTKLVLLLSPLINRYMVNKIDCISDEHLAYALHSLHMYLWPDEVIVNAANTGQDNSANIEKIVECLEDLFSSNYFLHNGVYSVKSTVLEKMKLFILSLQDEKLNKCLLFHMFDVIVEYVCSEA